VSERLSAQEMADLSAFADGTLPDERRAEVEARLAGSPELLEVVERQRQSLAATRALSADEPSPALVETVERLGAKRDRRTARSQLPRVALAGGLAAVAAIVAAIVFTGGPAGPTVADAARLASKPATAPAPPPLPSSSTRLAANVEGVAFPNLVRWAGWHATGARHGRIRGRDATVVFYRKNARHIAYVIVAGPALPRPSGAQATTANGVRYQTFLVNGRLAVTWRRAGRTCVLIGDATRPELVHVASWKLSG
jgi:anti-sigma factor RsiW